MPYSAEQVAHFVREAARWQDRASQLVGELSGRAYRHEQSRLLVTHGLGRRLMTLTRCIKRVYGLIPPDEEAPSREELQDAAIFLQSFLINVFGAQDNLACLWVWESGLQHNGREVRPEWIGLRPGNTVVRNSLSPQLREYLESMTGWFDYLENYRHALAHRIPLYIPPKRLDEEEVKEYRRLEASLVEAIRHSDFERYGAIMAEQARLGVFEPWMMHSYGPTDTDGRPVRFHGQMVCDLATVVDLGERMIAELDALERGP